MIKWLIYRFYLRPLILEDLRLRFLGEKPDEWFWADRIASDWGYSTEFRPSFKDYNDLSVERLADMLVKMSRDSR